MLPLIRNKLENNKSVTFDEALTLMNLQGLDCMELFSLAHNVRSKLGERVDLCSIVNAKCGQCPEDCKFCAQSVHNDTEISSHEFLDEEDILNMALMMQDEGAARFCIVISGTAVDEHDLEQVLNSIKRIRSETSLSICASIGKLTGEIASSLKHCGVTRIHHNLETSANYFHNVCTTHTYEEKIDTVKIAKRAGLEICCGGIIGMGESDRDVIELAFALKELDVDSIPINILNPVPGTPLEHILPRAPMEILKTIAVFRLVLPGKNIRIAGGREKNLRDLQSLSLLAGANGLLLGNYLTTPGRYPKDDIQMIKDLGFIPGGVHV